MTLSQPLSHMIQLAQGATKLAKEREAQAKGARGSRTGQGSATVTRVGSWGQLLDVTGKLEQKARGPQPKSPKP